MPATELERGDWLVCSDGTRVRIAYVSPGEKRVVLRLAVSDAYIHPLFSVRPHTTFMRES